MHWTRTLLLILTLNFLLFPTALFAQEKILHIAFVSPTEEEPAGLKALKLYLDDIDWRTHNGFKIELDYYVDNNNKTQAEAVAKQIVKDNRAILVIGHNYSSTSSAAGPIYAQNAIPAISYSATNPKVTQNNPWYFRTIFNDASQGSFLAYYALKNLNYDHITIIYEPDNYGSFLAQVFEENAYLNGAKRVQSFKLNMNAPDEFKYRELHAAITSNKEQAGLIFMATHSSEGIKLVKLLRDVGVKNPIMGPDAFYSTAFIHGFDDEAKELNNPGYYTNGIFLSAPIVFDVANAEAQQLKRQYLQTYGELPDWASAYGYDTAKVLAAVIASSQERFNHTASSLADRREAVQRALAELNSPQNAVQGVTGLNYFDQNGDAVKPIFIAVLHDKRVVSGLSQYKDVPNVDEVTNLAQQLASGSIIELADRYMYKMSVVFTGVKLHHIRRIDTQQHTSELDFTLWFRYRGDFDPSTLEFSNSIDDISLPAPYMESESGNIRYKAFRIKGLFRNDFMDDIQRRGQISIGFALRNTEMDRNTLLYARDTKGIGLTGNTQLIDLVKHQVLSEEIAGWRVENASIFERSVNVDSLGLPQYINIRDANVPYSQFHYIVELKQTGFRLSDVLPESSTQVIAILSSLLFVFAFLPRYLMATRLKGNLPLLRIRWIVITLSTVMLLGASESWISQHMFPVLDVHFQKWILHAYDLAWWILPAILLVRAVNVFVWQTMQIQSGRPIPRVIQSLLAFVIYTLALFAIVAFVYNQKLTGLLATSGLLAMIIGLAIQMNLSNIFSGIALNLEHPFRVGDWVRIGDHEGQVIDINWRATRLLTRVKHVISIPNTPAADTAVINYSTKEGATRQILMVGVHPIHPMETVKPLLISAAFKHPSVLREPEPTCTFAGIKEGVALYRLIYSYSDYALMFQVEDEIWSRMIKNFKQAGINYVPPMQRIEMNKPKPDPFVYREEGDFISHAELFSGLPEEFHRTLTDKLNELHFNAGEMILDKDRHYHSVFIIRNGVAAVLKENASGISLEQQRLGIDDLINLELLYTDDPLNYNVQAVVDLTVLEIPESLLKELFRKHHASYEIFKRNIQRLAEQQQTREGKEVKDHSKISSHFAWLDKE